LVNDDIDRLLLAAHCEIQRLAEEFRQGARLWGFLRPVLEVLRRSCIEPPYRIVDVGCGTGYVIRWLAAHEPQPDVELIGVDFNTSLVDAARGLAAQEDLRCHFAVGDAFALDEPATIVISTGVLHHFRGDDLDRFFAAHQSSAPAAFVHVDFQPSPIAGFGAWLFHRTRMRLAISRHDGIRSAQRAHPPDLLVRTAAAEAPDYVTWVSGRRVRGTPFPCVLTNLIGARRELGDLMRDELDRHLDGPEAVR
jgi:SAM-dependent methyltransferase